MGRTRWLLAGTAVTAIAAVGVALVSQHVYDQMPCPWCVLQRLIFLLVAAGALLGLAWTSMLGRLLGAGLALTMAGAGIATALWQHFVAAASASCNLTFADKLMGATGLDRALPEVFAAYASCADAKVDLLHVPYEFWSLALFVLLGGVMLMVLRGRD
jgi:disulfide bond formation protein DsbB